MRSSQQSFFCVVTAMGKSVHSWFNHDRQNCNGVKYRYKLYIRLSWSSLKLKNRICVHWVKLWDIPSQVCSHSEVSFTAINISLVCFGPNRWLKRCHYNQNGIRNAKSIFGTPKLGRRKQLFSTVSGTFHLRYSNRVHNSKSSRPFWRPGTFLIAYQPRLFISRRQVCESLKSVVCFERIL